MALPKEDIYTIEDIYALPDGERADLIDGQIYYMAPPSRKHQKLSGEIFGIIRGSISGQIMVPVRCMLHPLQYTWMNIPIPM